MLCYDMCGSLPAARVLGTWKLWPVSASVSGKKKKKEAIVVSITRGRKSTFGALIHGPRSHSVGDLFEGRTQ